MCRALFDFIGSPLHSFKQTRLKICKFEEEGDITEEEVDITEEEDDITEVEGDITEEEEEG